MITRTARVTVGAVSIVLCCFGLISAVAEDAAKMPMVERHYTGKSGQTVRVGVYFNMKGDCTSGPLPIIQLVKAPAHGQVRVKRGKIAMTNRKPCLAAEVPAYVAFYHPDPAYTGKDELELRVKIPNGQTVQDERITITVGAPNTEL